MYKSILISHKYTITFNTFCYHHLENMLFRWFFLRQEKFEPSFSLEIYTKNKSFPNSTTSLDYLSYFEIICLLLLDFVEFLNCVIYIKNVVSFGNKEITFKL